MKWKLGFYRDFGGLQRVGRGAGGQGSSPAPAYGRLHIGASGGKGRVLLRQVPILDRISDRGSYGHSKRIEDTNGVACSPFPDYPTV